MVFAREDSPVYLMGGFDLMAAMLDNQPSPVFSARAITTSLVSARLPALDGVVAKLARGASVADLGRGHGCPPS
jgi:hypothetical protein